MARFLKFIVNTIMIVAIVVAASLLVPPFAGVTTVIVDDIEMETNLKVGSVTYAWGVEAEELKEGDHILLQEEADMVYCIASVNGSEFVLEDELSTDGGVAEKELQGIVDKVLFTVPVLGYVSMALRTVEGLIIVGLSVVFVIILFALAEIWRKEEEEEWEEDEEDDESADSEEILKEEISKKEASKVVTLDQEKKNADKEAEETVVKTEKNDHVSVKTTLEDTSEEAIKTDAVVSEFSKEEQELLDETNSFLGADIASMLGLDKQQKVMENENIQKVSSAKASEVKVSHAPKEKVLAMPLYTKEELLERAKAAGDEPELVMDELSGVTFLDYSDVI